MNTPEKTESTYNKYLSLFIILSISIIPFLFIKEFNDPAQSPIFFYVNFISGIYLSFSLYQNKLSISFNVPTILIASILISGIISTVFNTSNSETYYEFSRLCSLIVFTIALISLFRKNTKYVHSLIIGITSCFFIFLGFGIFEMYQIYINEGYSIDSSYKITAHLAHRNILATTLVFGIPIVIKFFQSYLSRFKSLISVLFLLIISIYIYFLQSRIGIIALGVLIILYFIVFIFQKKKLESTIFPKLIILTFIVSLISLLSLLLFYKINPEISLSNKYIRTDYHTINTYTLKERIILWDNSISLASKNMLLGVGPGQWKFKIGQIKNNLLRPQNGKIIFIRPHNDFLWYLTEYGIITCILYTFLLFFIVYKSSVFLFNRGEFYEYSFVFIGIFVFIIISFVEFPKERPFHLFLLSFYIAYFIYKIYPAKSEVSKLKSTIKIIFFYLLLFSSLIFYAYRLFGEFYLNKALAYRIFGNSEKAYVNTLKTKEFHIDFDMTATPLEFYESEHLFYTRKVELAEIKLKQSIQKNPYHLYSLSNLGTCYYVLNKPDSALKIWNQTIDLAPSFGEARVNKSILLYENNYIVEASNNLFFNLLVEDSTRYEKQIGEILGAYCILLAQNESNILLNKKLQELAANPKWLSAIQKRGVKSHLKPIQAIGKELIYILYTFDKSITIKEKNELCLKYGVNEKFE